MVSITAFLANILLLRSLALAGSNVDPALSVGDSRISNSNTPSPASVLDELRARMKSFPFDEIPYVIRSSAEPKFKDGIFEFNKRMLSRLRSSDRDLASRLVSVIPKHTLPPMPELVRRQDGGNATTTPITSVKTVTGPAPTTTVVDTSTAQAPTTDRKPASSPSPESSPSPSPSPSSSPSPSPSPKEPVTNTPTTSVPTSNSVFINSSPSTLLISSATSTSKHNPMSTADISSFSSSHESSTPTTSGSSSAPESTSHNSSSEREGGKTSNESGPPKPTTKHVFETTTLPNGSKHTLTAVTVITPSPSPTNSNEPSLQSGAAHRVGSFGGEAVALVAGAVGVVYMF